MTAADTPLAEGLVRLIAAEGPISLARYMQECLGHPEYGYYRRGDPFGAAGDFVTAPEVSQIFGELIGLWFAERWDAMGRPHGINLVELGPGRGTLMADLLRALDVMPALPRTTNLHLVESNETLRAVQVGRLAADWHEDFESVPDGPLFVVANEFFDALPIQQYVKTEQGWAERLVTWEKDGFALTLGASGEAPAAALPHSVGRAAEVGSVLEICPEADRLGAAIGRRIAAHGGAALIIDYGYLETAFGESLQAVRRHQPVDLFHRPGQSDLTAHVNFARLADAFERGGALPVGPVTQGRFLFSLGIEVRAALLARRANPRQAKDIDAAVRRLTAPDMMGELFKVLAVVDQATGPVLPGFVEFGDD